MLLWEGTVEGEEAAFEEMAVVVVQHKSREVDSIDSDYSSVPAAGDSLSKASSVAAAAAVDSSTDPGDSDLISAHHTVAGAVAMNSGYPSSAVVDTVVAPRTDPAVDSSDAVHTDLVSVSADCQAVIHLASLSTLTQFIY